VHRGPGTTAGSLAALRAPSARQRCCRSLRNDFGNAGLSTWNRYVTERVWIFLNAIVQLGVREVRVDSAAQAIIAGHLIAALIQVSYYCFGVRFKVGR